MGTQIEDTPNFLKFIFKHYSDQYDQLNWPNLYEYKLQTGRWYNDEIYIENYPTKVGEDVKIFLSQQDKIIYIQKYIEFLRYNFQNIQVELDHYEPQIT